MGAKRGTRSKAKRGTKESKLASKNKHLSPKYILENKDSLDFSELCKVYPFYEPLANLLKDKLDWNVLYISNDVLDKIFFYNNENYINWKKISSYKNIPERALYKCPDRLIWSSVCKNTKMSEETLENLYKYLDINMICVKQKLTMEFIERHFCDLKPFVTEICDNQKLTEDFMRKYKDDLDWSAISRSQKLTEDFMNEMSDYIDWTWASCKQKMNSAFIEKNIDKVNLYCLIKRDVYIPKSIKKTSLYEVSNLYTKKKHIDFDQMIKEEAG